jgi:hypothetical protein
LKLLALQNDSIVREVEADLFSIPLGERTKEAKKHDHPELDTGLGLLRDEVRPFFRKWHGQRVYNWSKEQA